MAVVAGLLGFRVVAAFVPTSDLWGVDLLRFTAPNLTLPWIVMAGASLVPAIGRPVFGWIESRCAGVPPALAWCAVMLGSALVVWWQPDRLMHVGDTMMRDIALRAPTDFAALNPQATPLDGWLHDTLVRWFAQATRIPTDQVTRLIGALEAAAMAALAMHTGRVLGARGPVAWAVCLTVLGSGALGLFTGYNKVLSELALCTVALTASGLRLLRTGRGALALGLSLAGALALHRLGLALIPATIVALVLVARRDRPPRPPVGRTMLLALLPAGIVLLGLGRTLIRVVTQFDRANFGLSPLQDGAASLLSTAGDAVQMVLFVAPLAPLALGVFWLLRDRASREAALFLLSVVTPMLAVLLLFRSPLGLIRNWDVFAPLGAALSVAAALVATRVLEAPPRRAWLGGALALNAAVPAAVMLLHHHDLVRGLERMHRIAREPSTRSATERGSTWDFIGQRLADTGDPAGAAEAFTRAASLTPSPRILRQWAMMEIANGRPRHAASIYRDLLVRRPEDGAAWMEYVRVMHQLGDTASARHAALDALQHVPGARGPREYLRWLDARRPSSPAQ